ncbi:MAG: hypothetical protein IKZ25_01495 [Clostridia bacterium]|nr:hypothetical protein [Clostridia bacterium]
MAIFTNQATLSYNNAVTNSNVATGEILEVISATKTAVMDSYVQNDDITYIVSITNSGTVGFSNLTVTDNLGAYPFGETTLYPLTYTPLSARYYINGVLQNAVNVTSEEPLVIEGISVPAGGNAILIYEARANQFAPLGTEDSIVNEATISGGGLTPFTATETVFTENRADLIITKSICPETVTENGQITYTLIIQNSGNTEAAATDNVVISDIFDPILTNISVTLNGEILPGTNYTYNEETGEFQTIAGAVTVPAATYEQDATNGNYIINPGVSVVTITGTV